MSTTDFSENDRKFILELIRDAQTMGLMAVEYKGLKLTLRPIEPNTPAPKAYNARWSTTLAAGENDGNQ